MATSDVYVAGVGISPLKPSTTSSAFLKKLTRLATAPITTKHIPDSELHDLAISAGTKALLDAGITYDDVNLSLACFLHDLRIPKASFNSYGKTGAPTAEVDCYTGFIAAAQYVRSGHAKCALMIGFDKNESKRRSAPADESRIAAVAFVLVSQAFLTSHPYLKDAAALVRATALVSPIYSRSSRSDSETLATKTAIQRALEHAVLAPDDIQIVELRHGSNPSALQALGELRVAEDGHASPVSNPFVGSTGLAGLCELVWQLRGWTRKRAVPAAQNTLQYTMGPDGTAYATILCRADGKAAPKWSEIEHLRDGRERLGYNPAVESKDISFEDWQAVKSKDEFVPEQTGERLQLPVRGGDRAALAKL